LITGKFTQNRDDLCIYCEQGYPTERDPATGILWHVPKAGETQPYTYVGGPPVRAPCWTDPANRMAP